MVQYKTFSKTLYSFCEKKASKRPNYFLTHPIKNQISKVVLPRGLKKSLFRYIHIDKIFQF